MLFEITFNVTEKRNYLDDYFVYQDDISHLKGISKILYMMIIFTYLMSTMYETT